MHPRCRHGVSTYYEGINNEPEEVTNVKHNHDKEDKYTQYLQQRQKQYERLAVGSLLPENILNYQNKANELKDIVNSNYLDITERYTIEKNYNVIEEQYFVDKDNHKYKVDGKNVIMKPTVREKEVANMLGRMYGGQTKIIPRINEPAGIKTPDYKVNNEKFD